MLKEIDGLGFFKHKLLGFPKHVSLMVIDFYWYDFKLIAIVNLLNKIF